MNKLWDSAGRKHNENVLLQREFFWDTAIASVVFSLWILVALDFVIESIRGSEVVCSPPYSNITTDEVNYINQYCTSNLPLGVHISTAMLIIGMLVLFPHYLWSYHFNATMKLFFQLVGTLQRNKEDTGNYLTNDVIMVKGLEESFSAGTIFYLYILKIGFQLAFVITGFVFAIVFFHGEFEPLFICPNTFNDLLPIATDVTCVFHPLNLLKALWIADILLLLLGGCFLVMALIWCFSTHPKELGSYNIANFLYHYGIPSKYYVSKASLFHLHCIGSMFQLAPSIRRISCSEPRIRTNLDFLIMKLHYSDGILASVLSEIRTKNVHKQLCEDDRRRLYIHARKHRNFLADDNNG